MSESKTPRSDAEESKARALYEQQREVDWPPFDSSPYDFARTLELELNEALASLPLVDDRVRNEAEKLLSQTLRHDDGNGASHGCVEVTGVKLRFELLIAQANQLRSQLTTAQQEIAALKEQLK